MQRLVTWLGGEANQSAEFWAGMVGLIPFILVGTVCFILCSLGLGQSWALSLGLMATIGGAIYELGRRDGQQS